MNVDFKTSGGAKKSSFDDLGGIRYARIGSGAKHTTVLVKSLNDYRCSDCDTDTGSNDCKHERIVADRIEAELGITQA
jgi:hypothetical protein